MSAINDIKALEILDSRGRPTVKAFCELASGARAAASVPSGTSTGAAEAVELRDGEPKRFRGLGCSKAVGHVNGEIRQAVVGREFGKQADLDRALIDLDGTPNKSRLGANAVLAVSLAFARATAEERHLPLYQHFAELRAQAAGRMPRPMINLFSGGLHAGCQVPLQDVLVVPVTACTTAEALAMTYEVYQCAAALAHRKYGMRILTAYQGGLAPPFPSAEKMIEDAVTAIQDAGFTPGQEVAIAIDVAANTFHRQGRYYLGGRTLRSDEMVELLAQWVDRYPIVSLEDGLAENDWDGWSRLRERLGQRSLILGDDLLTHVDRLRRAIDAKAANALLLKVNQIGTVTEAGLASQLAREAGWRVTFSSRSGETEDTWLADLAVGWGGDLVKIGSITQSDRLAKYNRLLEIEAETRQPLVAWPG